MNNRQLRILLTPLLVLFITGCPGTSQRDCEGNTSCQTVAEQDIVKPGGSQTGERGQASDRWVSAWGTSIHTTFPNGPIPSLAGISPNSGTFIGNEAWNQSFRMTIHPTASGDRVRFHFSNRYGDRPLEITNANVAIRSGITGPAIVPETLTSLTFADQSTTTIEVGKTASTDPADFSYSFGDTLAVSFHVPGPSGAMSWHAESFALQYASFPNSGDVTRDELGFNFGNVDRGWFFLRGMDIQLPKLVGPEPVRPGSIVAFGDSITDGLFSMIDMNQRWPDFLARRIQKAELPIVVVNAGIGSNTVNEIETDDPKDTGEAGVLRFHWDALERPGVRTVFVLLGTNDLPRGGSADEIYQGLIDLAEQARRVGVRIVVSTILPRNEPPVPSGWNPVIHEPERQDLNRQILNSEEFDAVVDLASVMANPLLRNQPFQPYFVEGLHPNPLGMKVLADAIPLEVLLPELEAVD